MDVQTFSTSRRRSNIFDFKSRGSTFSTLKVKVQLFRPWRWRFNFFDHEGGGSALSTMKLEVQFLRPCRWRFNFFDHDGGGSTFSTMTVEVQLFRSWWRFSFFRPIRLKNANVSPVMHFFFKDCQFSKTIARHWKDGVGAWVYCVHDGCFLGLERSRDGWSV